jgi:hypothetical protein
MSGALPYPADPDDDDPRYNRSDACDPVASWVSPRHAECLSPGWCRCHCHRLTPARGDYVQEANDG